MSPDGIRMELKNLNELTELRVLKYLVPVFTSLKVSVRMNLNLLSMSLISLNEV